METSQKKKDRSTVILLIVALALLGLVILFFQRELLFSFFKNQNGSSSVKQERVTPPKIERLGDLEEPLVDATGNENETTEIKPSENTNSTVEDTGPSIRTPIYYITVTDDGAIHLKSVIRSIPTGDHHIRQSLEILLSGPETAEINKGLFSMIPPQSRLLSFDVRDKIAFCNFNEEFQFNDLGREGYIAQLAQIVFTLTEFQDIDSVQILIEGKKRDYLGADGVAISEPLSRTNF